MEKPLQGQTVLVTGASGGIGAAIVERIALEGARPIIHYCQDEHAAELLLARIGGNGLIVQSDLSDSEGPCALWQKAVAFAGRIHGVINNAGIRTEIPIEASSKAWKAAWQKEFQLNVFAAADLCREAIQHFRTEGGGRIVNMAGQAGQRGSAADVLPHGATEAALINLTKSIAYGFGREGVMAMSIAPGLVRTERAGKNVAAHDNEADIEEIPIGDMAEPTEIAELVAFVLRYSQESLNGATLDVNGGSYIR
ncbi:SDR family NAD(P)-dependent oxidoreductase [Shinella sp. HZN7]|uniref:SDR family NAD(P)-dependent oxidoreductase n=1 Tax=Shinella sp. (strain HZN7) TaxID=879274 RepID=UPI0007DA6F82|nr:SDR family oxidoreductase [Shinella sp. HZN7]ANH08625.1 epimerase [Shinella sp. HZN7]